MNDPTIQLPAARLTKDPEIRQSKNGTTYMLMNIAASGNKFNKQTNQWENSTTLYFQTFEFDERMIETYRQTLHKGTLVQVTGVLEASAYQGNDGNPKPQLTIKFAKISLPLRGTKTQNNQYTQQNQAWNNEDDVW